MKIFNTFAIMWTIFLLILGILSYNKVREFNKSINSLQEDISKYESKE